MELGASVEFVHRDGRKLEGEAARSGHATPYGLHEVRKMTMARIEAAEGIGDADDGPLELIERIAHGSGKGAPHVDGEVWIAVILQAAQVAALRHRLGRLFAGSTIPF